MRGLCDRLEERMKKRRLCENQIEEIFENEDRLSDLPDCVILHILSFLNTKQVVQTCVLSTRWKRLWKLIPTLILHSYEFRTVKKFTIFANKILTLLDTSALDALDLYRSGNIEPRLLKKILNYVCSHNTHLRELQISVCGDSSLILSRVSSCQAVTSLKLSLYARGSIGSYTETLFPKSLNLPLLTSLYLENFTFCGSENGCAEPFSTFTKLNSLALTGCKTRDADFLSISSEILVDLAIHVNSKDFVKLELSTPNLSTFKYTGAIIQKIYGSGLSSVKKVNINSQNILYWSGDDLVLLNWLQDLSNVESLTVTSTTLQILSLVPDLLEVKLRSLCNLKSLEVELVPLYDGGLLQLMKDAMLKKAAAKSPNEVAKLRKAFKAHFEAPAIPDGIVDFLRQNSPSAEVNINTRFPTSFNLKQVEESIKGAKIVKCRSQLSTPASLSAPASVAEPGTAAPPNLHLCLTEKDDKSSNKDTEEKHQHNTDSPLRDIGQ